MSHTSRLGKWAFAGVLSIATSACFADPSDLVPPRRSLYFPTALVVSPGRTTLYVVNSDFDLQYNGGTVQSVNLVDVDGQPGLRSTAELLATAIEQGLDPEAACATIGSRPNNSETLHPGPCEPIQFQPFVRDFATIGAFANAAAIDTREDGKPGARLFVSVRGDPSITYFDIPDDRDPAAIVSPCDGAFCLDCSGEGDEKRCARKNQIGENVFTSQRGLLLPTEPSGVDVQPDLRSDAVVVAHQTTGTASLVVNHWPSSGDDSLFESTPSLEFLLDGLADGPSAVLRIPPPAVAFQPGVGYQPGFIISHRAAASLTVVRYVDDAGATPPRPFLTHADDVSISVAGDNSDMRGMAFDTTNRAACENLCGDTASAACLSACAENNPVPFYVASRAPASLVIGELTTTTVSENGTPTGVRENITFDESVSMPLGAAAVAVAKVIAADGSLETRVFVVSFDSRFVTIYDPRLHRVEAQIRTGRGPGAIAFDVGPDDSGVLRSYMYLAHFTDSYLSVVDLDTRRITYGTTMFSAGPPVAPREEQ
ncbi:MAG: hypothetical protein U0271_32470 [Polyangiaceae bacterium]